MQRQGEITMPIEDRMEALEAFAEKRNPYSRASRQKNPSGLFSGIVQARLMKSVLPKNKGDKLL